MSISTQRRAGLAPPQEGLIGFGPVGAANFNRKKEQKKQEKYIQELESKLYYVTKLVNALVEKAKDNSENKEDFTDAIWNFFKEQEMVENETPEHKE